MSPAIFDRMASLIKRRYRLFSPPVWLRQLYRRLRLLDIQRPRRTKKKG